MTGCCGSPSQATGVLHWELLLNRLWAMGSRECFRSGVEGGATGGRVEAISHLQERGLIDGASLQD